MDSSSLSIALLPSFTHPQIQTTIEWRTEHSYPNLDLEIALNLVLQGRIILQKTGGWVVISYTAPTLEQFSSTTIRGVMIASSRNANVSLVSGDRATTESLFALTQPCGCSRRVSTSSQTKD